MYLKRLAAILLWGILLFNWMGYRLLTGILEQDASQRLEARLDRQQYDEDQLISIKVPLTHLTYYNTSAEFQRTDGTIDVNGVPYQYVKCRMYNDSLEMLCIPNATELKLRHADPDSHPYVSKSFAPDPYTTIPMITIGEPPCILIQCGCHFSTYFPSLSLPAEDRPPACPMS
jgi:hypothetical protein